MRTFILPFALVALASVASIAQARPGDGCGYAYADDFTGNKVEVDSYAHSFVYSQFCLNCLPGWLMFVTDSAGNRGLGFYPGQAYGSLPASVAYQFPHDGIVGGMTGALEFDALPTASIAAGWGFGSADVRIKYDDTLAATARITQSGH